LDAKEYVTELRDTLCNLQAKGVETLSTEKFIKYLDKIKDSVGVAPLDAATMEKYKAELEARAHLTMAEVSRARSIFRQPRSPQNIARAWRLVATVRTSVAFAESDPRAARR